MHRYIAVLSLGLLLSAFHARAEMAAEGTEFRPEIDAQALSELEARLQKEYDEAARTGKLSGNQDGGKVKGEKGDGNRMAEKLKEFDANGDGQLSEKEKQGLRVAFAQRIRKDPELQAKVLEKYDLNKNEKLDDDEQAAMEGEMKAHVEGMKKLNEHLLKRFDADGDGTLNEAERAQAEAGRKQFEGRMREAALKRYDADGDGKLSATEEAKAREDWQQRRRQGNK
ncbi:MAG: hypothetical protein AMXMBFR7_24300 [Planctomycetota bacterium]